jgi:hypothetical protein
MRVQVFGHGRLVVVSVCCRLHNDRYKGDLTMGDAAFGDHRLGKVAYQRGLAAEHGNFETAVVIEMNMQSGDLQLVMRVMRPGQPFGQFSRMVIEHIGKGGHAFPGHAIPYAGPLETQTREIADGLRPVLIPIVGHEGGKFSSKLVGHADRYPFRITVFPSAMYAIF